MATIAEVRDLVDGWSSRMIEVREDIAAFERIKASLDAPNRQAVRQAIKAKAEALIAEVATTTISAT